MTSEERTKYYEARQRYQWQCEEFKEEMFKYLSHYEPRNLYHLPQLRA